MNPIEWVLTPITSAVEYIAAPTTADLITPAEFANDLAPFLIDALPPMLAVGIGVFGMMTVFKLVRRMFLDDHYVAPVRVSEPMKALPTRTERQKAIAEIEAEHLKVTDKRTCKCAYCLGSVKPVSLTPPTVEDWEGWEHYGLLAPKAGAR